MTSLSNQEETLAKALFDARTKGALADATAVPVPVDAASAMRVQTDVITKVGDKVVGWKVGFGPDGVPFAGPMIASTVSKLPGRWAQKPGPNFRIEVEIGVRLAKDLPVRPGKPYTRSEITAAIDTVFCGIEMLWSRYADPSKLVFLQGLADSVHNGGYLLGQEKKTQEIPATEKMVCRATLDGVDLFNGTPKHPQDDILLPLIEYASNQNDGLGGLKAGQIITTGALCGVVETAKGGKFVASLTGFEDMVMELAHN